MAPITKVQISEIVSPVESDGEGLRSKFQTGRRNEQTI